MEIKVKNNDTVKAYRVLMKKLNKEYNGNYFETIRSNMYYIPPSLKKRIKHEKAVKEIQKIESKREKWFEKEEQRQIIESKRRAQALKKQKHNKRKN